MVLISPPNPNTLEVVDSLLLTLAAIFSKYLFVIYWVPHPRILTGTIRGVNTLNFPVFSGIRLLDPKYLLEIQLF